MEEWQRDRLASALSGTNPTVLMRMKSGFVVFCDTQFLPGYCILLGYPQNGLLNELPMERRTQFLTDMSLVGDAITRTVAPLRINYAIMCNDLQLLHAHIAPRYSWEAPERVCRPVMQYPETMWSDEQYRFDRPEYADVRSRLEQNLKAVYQEWMNAEGGR